MVIGIRSLKTYIPGIIGKAEGEEGMFHILLDNRSSYARRRRCNANGKLLMTLNDVVDLKTYIFNRQEPGINRRRRQNNAKPHINE